MQRQSASRPPGMLSEDARMPQSTPSTAFLLSVERARLAERSRLRPVNRLLTVLARLGMN